ncbi:MAG: carboxy-S-adenosyl-L-methionine synthase CmoA [gamma proteobacterium symbiont of Bathyaustriella thionipta]|nr:carboxy-S-adenosyl-L-methionine synthase CmoA [gamma proteobacterium symbiont of Bathyaustriella thionipta]MCU7950731.1 carboxy-S-adenosyl-L-methionine synthase CmoA [gamma proteobacterium symbiont of Bathyaustriella thionipta]MCU7954264.1 carboxy-S-adenosyl-L-methionine synthase CmoA [gamma proteobacterium symbiont of Bathyaustriella thionipta]MCU7957223.1 carboxy-S-adenosyl-L-methionine synthase CmoA [gamma proteobacterium symbiont of Bathyaustriella thionipta]MCU7966814.1 carboxy-S-adenos
MSTNLDTLYSRPLDKLVDFNFDEKVANVFPDMINRSVPGYASIVAMTGILSAEFFQPHTQCYDLGCSLGASALSMAKAIKEDSLKIIAVDNSQAMLQKAELLLQQSETSESTSKCIEFICDDINKIDVVNTSVVVMNFTLQFILPAQRSELLKKIYQGMNKGGILILSEKLNYNDTEQQQLLIDMHHFFKKANGYSDLEISQKRQTIENVLLPETLEDHKLRLKKTGFKQVEQWFQCFNFSSLIAIK